MQRGICQRAHLELGADPDDVQSRGGSQSEARGKAMRYVLAGG